MTEFRERLAELIQLKGVNTSQMQADGISSSAVSKWLRSDTSPTIKSLLILANYFECSVDFLVGNSNETKRYPCNNASDFTNRFNKLFSDSECTYYRVAKDTDMMPADIKKYLNGKLPQMNNLIKLAKFFNCSVDYLIGIADDE